MASLPPAFREDGVVTAGNSSAIVDGSAAMLVASEERATALGLEPRARFVSFGLAGVDPYRMLHGNPQACEQALAHAGLSWDDMAVIEVNEAFASVVLQFVKDTGLGERMDDVNPNGGGISLGHPLGATGARITATLLNELDRRDAKLRHRDDVHRPGPGDRRRPRTALTERPQDVVARGYDAGADAFAAWQRRIDGSNRLERIDELLALLPEQPEILELGSGAGVRSTRVLAERARLTGVDISAEQVRRARERVPGARFVHADFTQIEFEPASFDAVVALYVFNHVPRGELARCSGGSHAGCGPAAT